jgi:hypothetical protein
MTVKAGTSAAQQLPGDSQRWRCAGCGNLTRFDVVRTATLQEFWHVDLAGVAQVEESTTTAEVVQSVSCRWCGRADSIELVPRPDSEDG